MKQDEYFRSLGGDAYFERNFHNQGVPRRIPGFHEWIASYASNVGATGKILFLGGGAGVEAAAAKIDLPDWEISNLDVSEKAIEFGRKNFPSIRHYHASLTDRDLGALVGNYDIVLAVGLLLWLDRQLLDVAVRNIDSLLIPGSVLGIHDFFPPEPRAVEISHSPGFYTYKQDYSNLFLSTGSYRLLRKEILEYDDERYDWVDRLVGFAFLQKTSDATPSNVGAVA